MTRPSQQDMLKGVLQVEMKGSYTVTQSQKIHKFLR